MSAEINILVNGNRCKTYVHEGRTYLEGKVGSEYEIEIKNNSGYRIEAVASVDGLSVMTGKSASDQDGGYIIDPYASYRIKGFRYSDERVGAFRFNTKDQSYAATKGDKSEINCGVIACKVFQEQVYIVSLQLPTVRYVPRTVWDQVWEYNSVTTPIIPTYSSTACEYSSSWSSNSGTEINYMRSLAANNCSVTANGIAADAVYCSNACDDTKKEVFNLGTGWGSDKVSKVITTTFKRGIQLLSTEIFYTDRDGLLALGVPLNVPAKVHFPESFPGNYAQPPKGWTGR